MEVMKNNVNQTQNQTSLQLQAIAVTAQGHDRADDHRVRWTSNRGSKISYDSTKTDRENPLGEFFKALSTQVHDRHRPQGIYRSQGGWPGRLHRQAGRREPADETAPRDDLSADALKEMAEPTFAICPQGRGKVTSGPARASATWADRQIREYLQLTLRRVRGTGDKMVHLIKVDPVLATKSLAISPARVACLSRSRAPNSRAAPRRPDPLPTPPRQARKSVRRSPRRHAEHRNRRQTTEVEAVPEAGIDHRDDGRRPDGEEEVAFAGQRDEPEA